MRLLMIHQGPSCECSCPVCHDGVEVTPDTTFQVDSRATAQGRPVLMREDGTPRGGAIAGLMFTLAFWLVVGIVLVVVGSR